MLLSICVYCFKGIIHQSTIVNEDQTGVILVDNRDGLTNRVKDFKQVLIHENDKKRSFTCIKSKTGTS